jgi:N utilization substance protein B
VLHHAGPPDVDDPGEDEHAFVVSLVRGAMDNRDALDERIGDAAKNWRVERMAVLDRLVMRLALEELLRHRESPPRVVMSEAIELARAYSGEEAAKFVNGVLDGAYRRLKDEGLVTD